MLMYLRLCLPVGSAKRLKLLGKAVCYTQILFPNLCKQNYLCGNLPFYKIQVNCFMAWDELSAAILNFKTFLSFH